jgi:hypothetical protein
MVHRFQRGIERIGELLLHGDDYELDPHLCSELPIGDRRRPHAADAVVCLWGEGVVNESPGFRCNDN